MADLSAILNRLRKDLQESLGAELVSLYLYGSQARGEARPDSDVDVLIVVKDESDYMGLLERTAGVICGLSLENDIVISPAFISKKRFDQEQLPFIQNVKREAIAL